ncbi:hypothetical protein HHUSO_G23964 [Huso huso]|uniref:Uncharacterized protein n=1 Tax=Huso huso TaxID=61971 RepID=A0ABR0YU93_HUSHU
MADWKTSSVGWRIKAGTLHAGNSGTRLKRRYCLPESRGGAAVPRGKQGSRCRLQCWRGGCCPPECRRERCCRRWNTQHPCKLHGGRTAGRLPERLGSPTGVLRLRKVLALCSVLPPPDGGAAAGDPQALVSTSRKMGSSSSSSSSSSVSVPPYEDSPGAAASKDGEAGAGALPCGPHLLPAWCLPQCPALHPVPGCVHDAEEEGGAVPQEKGQWAHPCLLQRNSTADVNELPASGGQMPALRVSALRSPGIWPIGSATTR